MFPETYRLIIVMIYEKQLETTYRARRKQATDKQADVLLSVGVSTLPATTPQERTTKAK